MFDDFEPKDAPTVDQMIQSLRARIFETYGGHGNVLESPDDMCHRAADYLETARDLLKCLLENEPDDSISDAGHTVLDLWRHDVRRFLDLPDPAPKPVNHNDYWGFGDR